MDQAHDDEKKISAGGNSTNSKKVENLDSPQFQEMVRGFVVEKELLEKRHKDEMEKLKDNFSKKENVLSESHGGGQVHGESSQFGHSSSTMVGQSMQSQMMANGTRYSETTALHKNLHFQVLPACLYFESCTKIPI